MIIFLLRHKNSLQKLQKLFMLSHIHQTTVMNDTDHTLECLKRGVFPFKKINTAELKTGWCAVNKVRLKDIEIQSLKGTVHSARLTFDMAENSKEHNRSESQQTP